MSLHIADDGPRRDRSQHPCALRVPGGEGASAALALLDDGPRRDRSQHPCALRVPASRGPTLRVLQTSGELHFRGNGLAGNRTG